MFEFASVFQVLGDYGGHGHMDWGGGWGGWWVLMVIGMILFWGLVAYWLVREFGSRKDQRRATEPDDALAILDRRLAEGLVTPDEYRERRAILTGIDSRKSDSG